MAKKRSPARSVHPKGQRQPKAVGAAAVNPSPQNWSRVNRLQLAQLLGAHPDTVTDHTRAGMPVVERGGHGKESVYDAVACLAWWREQQGKNAKENAQTRLFNANAENAELKLQRDRGELLSRETVIKEGQAYTKAWTAKVRAWPRRARQLAIITTPEQEAALTALGREVLTEIARWRTMADLTIVTQEDSAA